MICFTSLVLIRFWKERSFLFYSQNLSKADITHYWSKKITLSESLSNLIQFIEKDIGNELKVALFPPAYNSPQSKTIVNDERKGYCFSMANEQIKSKLGVYASTSPIRLNLLELASGISTIFF